LFLKRSKYYAHYFDAQTGFIRGKLSDGSFRKDYNPAFSLHDEADYVEGNGWQYTFMVPHDVEGLITLSGGKKAFELKLDSLFTVSSKLNKGASIDISGLIGQYAHGNEPSHSTIYMYNYVDRPDKAATKIRQVLTNMYKPTPDGLCGNDDCGQMSAWYVMSALGFYPMNPVNGEYVLGSPLVEKATIRLENGRKIRLKTAYNPLHNPLPASVRVNNKPHQDRHITYEQLMKGVNIEFR
jgi:predicted alpha-1,2-mannosidase